MNKVFLISVILKGLGAVLEILLQITLTKAIGVAGYGTYSTWINLADLLFWGAFSGLVKCNTYYTAQKNKNIDKFKVTYYSRYVIPVILIGMSICLFLKQYSLCIVLLIAFAELLVLDQSSALLAKEKSFQSLFGEYILGRMILLFGIIAMEISEAITLMRVVLLYLLQYIAVFSFFMVRKNESSATESVDVSMSKLISYQKADIIHTMISQVPVLLQYFFVGAFEAGVVSVVILIRKLISFISGPTAKVFLPQFSRLYRDGKVSEIASCFESIMRIQMLFVSPLVVVMIGYPEVILGILAKELLPYKTTFVCCALVFLISSTAGPSSGLMQMTEHEKQDYRLSIVAVVAMLVTFYLFRNNPLFALYGLCVEMIFAVISKYLYVCKWMGRSPVAPITYMKWWVLPGVVVALSYAFEWNNSCIMMIVSSGVVFIILLLIEFKYEIKKKIATWR